MVKCNNFSGMQKNQNRKYRNEKLIRSTHTDGCLLYVNYHLRQGGMAMTKEVRLHLGGYMWKLYFDRGR
jgi:hypothetical protein